MISLKQAVDKQDEMEHLLRNLEDYKPKKPEKIESKEKALKNPENFFYGRNLIVHAFEENIFPLPKEKYLNMNNGQKKKREKNIFSLGKRPEIYC